MSVVICLDDSSDEEEIAGLAPARKPPAKNLTVAPKKKQRKLIPRDKCDDVVDLLDDSDDDQDVSARPELQCPHKTTKQPEAHESEEGSDRWYEEQTEMAKKASIAEYDSRRKKAPVKAKRVSLSQSPQLDSDSDSDGSILNYQVSFKRPSKHADPLQQHGFSNLSQSSSTSSGSLSGRIMNPYLKRAPKTPTNVSTARAAPSSKKAPDLYATATTNASKATSTIGPGSSKICVVNTYLTGERKVPATSQRNVAHIDGNSASSPDTGFPYPSLLDRSKKYEDLRARYILAFWKNARSLTLNSYDRPKLNQTITKIVSLALWEFPLRSLEEFCYRRKVSGTSNLQDKAQREELQAQLEKGGVNSFSVPVGATECGRYCSISEACLVAMATEVDKRRRTSGDASAKSLENQLSSKEMWISLRFLIPEIDKRLLPFCPGRLFREQDEDGGVAYYTDPVSKSAEYRQIEKLKVMCKTHNKVEKEMNNGSEGYIKQRKHNKQVVFELTPLGYKTAKWIETRLFPAPSGYYRTSHIASIQNVKPGHRDICLGMDLREGGLKKHVIHSMCNRLDWKGMPYFVGSLNIGDYAFFWTRPGPDQGKLCPVLVERKSIEDLAQSIYDGRWESQKRRMYKAQYVLGYENCRMAYLIEGKIEKQLVSGGFVGHRKFGIDQKTLDEAIEGLEAEGFDILRSTTPENSMFELAKWATRVGDLIRTGELKVQYTFAEFKEEVCLVSDETDFSRLAKYYMARRKEGEGQASIEGQQPDDREEDRLGSSVQGPASERGDFPAAPTTQNAGESIDLCSEDDAAENGRDKINKPRSTGAQNKAKGTQPPSQQDKHLACDSSSDESDDDLAEALKTVRRYEEKKRRKRKLKEAVKKKAKRRETYSSGGMRKHDKPCDPKMLKSNVDSTANITLSASPDTDAVQEDEASGDYETWSSSQLRAKCEEFGMPKTGKKTELLAKLRGPKPPDVWRERKEKGKYVPRSYNTGGTALLVALYLYEQEVGASGSGLSKEELYSRAEELEISKNPFSGGTTQNGPFHYDGWANMSRLLEDDPPLVVRKKHCKYMLSHCGPLSGFNLARAMHRWCHEHNCCNNCGCELVE